MLRLISAILFLAGLAAVGFGAWQMLGAKAPPNSAPAASAPADSAPSAATETETLPAPAPPMAESIVAGPASAGRELLPEVIEEALPFGDVQPESAPVPGLDVRLQRVPVAYEAPSGAKMGEVFDVTLSVDATGAVSAVAALPGRASVTEGEAQVSDRIMAALTGSTFEITARSPQTQTVSPLTANTWRWEVKAKRAGAQELTLEIFALVDGEALPVRTYRSDVAVQVSAVQQVIDAATSANPVFVILGGLGSLLAGFFGMARFIKGA